MKISELIEKLIDLQQEHGDVYVYVHNDAIHDDPAPEYMQGRWFAPGVYLN